VAAPPAPIRTERLVKVYGSHDNEVRAVAGLDLEVAQGEFFGLLGPNGVRRFYLSVPQPACPCVLARTA
jgi:ABC-type lipopolysaccharide export system ATPase subunit